MPFSLPSTGEILARIIFLFISAPIHEWAHAWSAYQLGDDTASLQGRMSLNPLVHLDPIGSILILLTGFGWAKPVPVSPYRMRTSPRTGMAISALAGPASNFLLAMLCAIPFRLGLLDAGSIWQSESVFQPAALLWELAAINVSLGLFNLLPLYPLDGEKVLAGLLPREWGDRLVALRPVSPYILMGLMVIGVAGLFVRLLWGPLMTLIFFL